MLHILDSHEIDKTLERTHIQCNNSIAVLVSNKVLKNCSCDTLMGKDAVIDVLMSGLASGCKWLMVKRFCPMTMEGLTLKHNNFGDT